LLGAFYDNSPISKSMKKILAFASLLALFLPAMACLNGFGELLENAGFDSYKSFPVPWGHPVDTKSARAIEAIYDAKRGYEVEEYHGMVDYGLYLIYDKQYEEAEKVFRRVAEKWPKRYESAANLGTILEVNGKTAEALKWIKKSIAIDPKSHAGSEWIHVKILEAKQKPGQAVTGVGLTGVDFGMGASPESALDTTGLKKLQKEIFFQLNERVTFIPTPDPYIAALMFELGNVTLALGKKEAAGKIYRRAEEYGFDDPLLKVRQETAGNKFKAQSSEGRVGEEGDDRTSLLHVPKEKPSPEQDADRLAIPARATEATDTVISERTETEYRKADVPVHSGIEWGAAGVWKWVLMVGGVVVAAVVGLVMRNRFKRKG
jgi:tetratricopeptide (TPR) repeat protein